MEKRLEGLDVSVNPGCATGHVRWRFHYLKWQFAFKCFGPKTKNRHSPTLYPFMVDIFSDLTASRPDASSRNCTNPNPLCIDIPVQEKINERT